MHQPERTCVGCRTRRPQSELLRVRRRSDGYLISANRARGGRSAYLCPARVCYDRAIQRHAFSRSLRARVSYDAAALWVALQEDQRALAPLARGKGGRDDG